MLTRAALKNPYAVLAICLIMLVLGALSYRQMRVDIVPEIKIPTILVTTCYHGLSPSEMEGAMALRMEQRFVEASDVEHIECWIHDGRWMEMTSGLSGDEDVVVVGQRRLLDGSPVHTSPFNSTCRKGNPRPRSLNLAYPVCCQSCYRADAQGILRRPHHRGIPAEILGASSENHGNP